MDDTSYDYKYYANAISKPIGSVTGLEVLPSIADIVRALGLENTVDLSEYASIKTRIAHNQYAQDDKGVPTIYGRVQISYKDGAYRSMNVIAADIQYRLEAQNYGGRIPVDINPLDTDNSRGAIRYHSLYDAVMAIEYDTGETENITGNGTTITRPIYDTLYTPKRYISR